MPSKKEVGSTAGLLAIAVVVTHTLFPLGQDGGKGSREKAQETNSIEGTKASSAEESVPLEGPWVATRAFFNPAQPASALIPFDTIRPLLSPTILLPASRPEWRDRLGLPDEDRLQSWAIVATVADPVHSRMQTFFDSQIQAIEKAVATHKWEFATQWLPWRDTPDGSPSGIEHQRRERQLEHDQEDLPGILVFHRGILGIPGETTGAPPPRKREEVLFVFLVAETPTKGIAGDEFYAALNLARVLSSNRCKDSTDVCKIGLLAPTFSGSFNSLARLLRAWDGREAIYKTVYGGSISSFENARLFEEAIKVDNDQPFSFRSGIAASNDNIAAFDKVLSYYNIERDKAAFWVEDESGFGASSFSALEKFNLRREIREIPIYRFPREISHLRSAYQEATQAARSTTRNASPRLDFSLKDPGHGEDSMPVFSDTHTPVAQSAAISTITEEFCREGTQMVFILAGNTLDSLLLAKFVRTESPNTRVLIGDADILFIPAASQESLAGTLFLSTYPMFILGQEWLTRDRDGKLGDKEAHLIFPSASHQGLFNVTQLLLAGIKADHHLSCNGDCLYGYRQLQVPSLNDRDHPGLWLLTVTHSGFLPLNWFPVNPEPWFDPPLSSATSPPGKDDTAALEKRFPLDDPSRDWYIAALSMSLAIFVACIWLLRSDYSFAFDRWFPALLGAGLSLTASLWILVLPAWRVLAGVDIPPEDSRLFSRITLSITIVAMIAPLFSFYLISRRSGGRTPIEKYLILTHKCAYPTRARTYAAVMIALFLWICGQWAWANGGLLNVSATNQPAFLFRMRAAQLFSGSSPSLPLFVLSLAFSAGFLLHFRRYLDARTEGREARPDPGLTDASITAVDESITAPFSLSNAALGWRLGISVALVALALLLVGPGMLAFELPQFNCALYIALAVVLFSLATACYDLLAIWRNLKQFLNRLEWGHKEAFERVTKTFPRRRLLLVWQAMPKTFFEKQVESGDLGRLDILALHVCRYLVYAVRQVQRVAWSIGLALVILIVVLTTYSVQAPQLVGRFVAVLFLAVGGIVVWVFASMEKNWILSRIDRTEPGDLNLEFWMQATAVVTVPLIGVLIHLFPSMGGFVSYWVAPSLEALR
jgi:hypothetical protein